MSLRNLWRGWRERKTAAAAAAAPAASADAATAAGLLRLGALQRQRAQYEEAARTLMRALELKHDCGEAHHNLGLVYLEQGHFEDAADCFELATHFAPRLAAAQLDLGATLAQLGRYDAAESACQRALELEPDSAMAWFRLGNIVKTRGDLARAVEYYASAIARDPALADAHCQHAFVLFKLGRYDESRASHAAALALNPEFVEAHHNLGLLELETGYPVQALPSFERALALRPGTPETRACIAHALRDLGRLDEALANYDAVLAEEPQFGDAIINRCYALLMRENYSDGWAQYERRFAATGTPPRGFPFPEWRGEPLAGKRILVYAEQGLGDEIMFASCLPDVLQRAGHVVIECNARLARLFARSFPRATVHGANKDDDKTWLQAMPRADFQVAIGSLPLHLRPARAAFPAHHGYLAADAARVEFWRTRLAAPGGRLRIGIAWRGGSLRTRRLTRSAALPHWQPLLTQPGVDFVSLQYGEIAGDLAQLRDQHGVTVRSCGDELADLDELAATVAALDLIISVDNTVVHLAGALGRPVWVLLPFAPEWRYPRNGGRMPWYPSARLFQQPRPREWGPVLAEAAVALQQIRDARGV